MKNLFSVAFVLFSLLSVSGCQAPNLNQIKEKSFSFLQSEKKSSKQGQADNSATTVPLEDILSSSLASGDLGSDFKSVLQNALEKDPVITSARRNLEGRLSAIEVSKAGKDFQVAGTVYGGIEDVTDNTKGVAVVLNASKLVFDGGLLDERISEQEYQAEAARLDLHATLDSRAVRLGSIWIELQKYGALQKLIENRLSVLDPLISQLERVAEAGIGDVSKVASAQRTVAEIRVAQTGIEEGLAQAKLNFINAYGSLPGEVNYDPDFVSKLVPNEIVDDMVQKAPAIASKYAAYQANAARIRALMAKDDFNVDFEVRATRPFGGSGYDSDESIGLVARKTIFNGGMLESEIEEAEAYFEGAAADIKAAYREGALTVENARQNIVSMDNAILLARKNASLTSDEIIYLRQQLVIGGSTLESVLSAEARLYDAESKEINFDAEKMKSELAIVGSLGLLTQSIGIMK